MAFGPVSDFRTAMGEIFLLTCRSVMTCQRRWAWGPRYGGLEHSFQSASFEVTKHPPKCLGYFNLSFLVEENKTRTHLCARTHTHTTSKNKKLRKASSITAFTIFLNLYHSDGSYNHEYQLRHRIRQKVEIEGVSFGVDHDGKMNTRRVKSILLCMYSLEWGQVSFFERNIGLQNECILAFGLCASCTRRILGLEKDSGPTGDSWAGWPSVWCGCTKQGCWNPPADPGGGCCAYDYILNSMLALSFKFVLWVTVT